MPQPLKPTPEKYCAFCGKLMERKRYRGRLESLLGFSRRKFCDQTCMAREFDTRHRLDTGWSNSHWQARQIVPPGPCSRCGKPGRDVHHKNGNWQDNSPENLERICRSCHSLAHERRKPCTICGKPQKGLGYCEMHYQRFKKHGDPLVTTIPPRARCQDCGAPAHAQGYCGRHYMQRKRAGTLRA